MKLSVAANIQQEVLTGTEVNTKSEVFMNIFRHSFDTAFPLEYIHENRPYNKGWVTQGAKEKSSKKIRHTPSTNKRNLQNIQKSILLCIKPCTEG